MKLFRSLQCLALAGAAIMFAHPSIAQSFPTKEVTIVSPFPPGGTTDVLARAIAQELSKSIGQQVIVENRPGAAGMIGTASVSRAAPDGHTLLLSTPGPISVNKFLYKNMTYNPDKDLVPVVQIGTVPQVVVVHPSVPAKNLAELIALAKKQPGKIHYGSGGIGNSMHLAAELFNMMAGTDLVHVPYKGSIPALTDLLGGQIQVTFDVISTVLPYVKEGKLRALAVTAPRRSKVMPDIPTVSEAGLAGYDVVTWYGLMAPAGTPPAVIDRLNKEVARVLSTPTVQEKLTALGADLSAGTSQEFADYLALESVKWQKVIKEANIPLQ